MMSNVASPTSPPATPTTAPLGIRRGVEKPRPLKCVPAPSSPTTRSDVSSVEEVLTLFERVCEHLSQQNYEPPVVSAIITLNGALKTFGPQAESLYKEQVDKLQSVIRVACRDDRLDLAARMHLLEVIELRAMNWITNDKVSSYYRQKLAELEFMNGACATSPTSSTTSLNANAPDFTPSYLQSPEIGNAVIPVVPAGQVLIPSGKFEKPVKVPGKAGNFKDEVVIRNADSGKVAVGARERLVQISGPDESRINQAKNLIEETIRRNQSPDFNEGFNPELPGKFGGGQTSPDISNTFVGEYKYTVNVGDQSLRIYGSNANLVRTAKIVLDDYFGEHKLTAADDQDQVVGSRDEEKPAEPSHQAPGPFGDRKSLKVIRQPLFPASAPEAFLQVESNLTREAEKRAKERRANFAKTNANLILTLENNNVVINNNVVNNNKESGNSLISKCSENQQPKEPQKDILRYDREFLFNCAKSTNSKKPPVAWDKILAEFPHLERNNKVSSNDDPIPELVSPKARHLSNNNLLFGKSIAALVDPRPDATLKTWDPQAKKWVELTGASGTAPARA